MNGLVHIIDDDCSFRGATARLLRLHGYDIVEYGSADQFLSQIVAGFEDGCILLDVSLPGLSGPELQSRLADIGSPFPIVFLTGHGDIPTTVSAIKSGAEDFLTKPVPSQKLLDSIERAIARCDAGRKHQRWLKNTHALLDMLSPRERQVFEFMVRGRSNRQTARALEITERTVKAHRHHIFEKLGTRSIADLVSMAERLGVLSERTDAEILPPENRSTDGH